MIIGDEAGYWREHRQAADSILSLVRDNTTAALASYHIVCESSATVLYCGLNFYWAHQHLTLSPAQPNFQTH